MTEIKLYNTMTKTKEVFTPLDKDNVRMYVCGPTVYDRAHIGNARPVVVFDVLYRLLRHVYGADHVTYARNFTDVDDKINAKAAKDKRSIRDITDETIGWFLEDMGELGALEPSVAPRATEYIPEMITMIEELIAKGHAYEAEGHALFDVNSYEAYGALSRRSVDDMIAGARVEVAPYKRNPMDFVLWKPSTGDQPGWDSPWGYGRPGWHIECSAMSRALFGESFDIHGGGLDLQFPHHENEIAQSCACCGEDTFAQVWMHNEMLQVEGKKMSKSLGNFFSVRELLDGNTHLLSEKPTGLELRAAFLLSPYRKTMDYGIARRHEAKKIIEDLSKQLGQFGTNLLENLELGAPLQSVVDALSNDLDTYKAMQLLRKKSIKKTIPNIQERKSRLSDIYASQLLLGFDLKESDTAKNYAQMYDASSTNLMDRAEELISHFALSALRDKLNTLRTKAKQNKNFDEYDAFKNQVESAGLTVQITSDGIVLSKNDRFDPEKLEALK